MKRAFIVAFIILLAWSCERNHPPVVAGITCVPDTRSAGTLFNLKASASDEDGNGLQYRWIADGGEFTDSVNRNQTTWKSPVDGNGKTFTIRVTVSDGKADASLEYTILLSEPVFGHVSGFACFTGSTIPVAGAAIRVEGKSAVTDTAGYFEIQDIPAGKWTLQASKDHFSLVSQSVNIIQNVTAKITIPMVSVILTSKITGIVKGQDSLPIAGARIIMLNPDGKESGIMATSDESGSYRLWYVPFGRRRIVVNRNQTAEFGFDEVMLDLSVTEPEHPLDIEMRKYSLEGKFTDGRDNHEYAYRVMGKQTWMAENLAFLPAVSPAKEGSETVSRYYVQGYESNIVADAKLNENFSVYGALYNWTAAQGACPRGWHLPGDAEWKTLENFLGPDPGYGMKSIFGWLNHGNGNNSTGFNVVPAGKRNDKGGFTGTEPGIFGSLGYSAHFWLTTIVLGHGAWTRSFYSDDNNVYRVAESLAVGLSVRCLKD